MSMLSNIRRNKKIAIGLICYSTIIPFSYYNIIKYNNGVNNQMPQSEENSLESLVDKEEINNEDKTRLIIGTLGLGGLMLYTILALSPRKRE